MSSNKERKRLCMLRFLKENVFSPTQAKTDPEKKIKTHFVDVVYEEYWKTVFKILDEKESYKQNSVFVYTMGHMTLVSSEMLENEKIQNKKFGNRVAPKCLKPLTDPDKNSEEIFQMCVVPITVWHWDMILSYFELSKPDLYHGNAARNLMECVGILKLPPERIQNMPAQLYDYLVARAKGEKTNSFYKNPIECVFLALASFYLLQFRFDLDSSLKEVYENQETKKVLVDIWRECFARFKATTDEFKLKFNFDEKKGVYTEDEIFSDDPEKVDNLYLLLLKNILFFK